MHARRVRSPEISRNQRFPSDFAFQLSTGERLHSAEMIDARNFRYLLDRYFNFAHVGTTDTFVYGGKIIRDGVTNILHRFLLGFSLRPTTGKRGAIHRVTFFRLMKHDLISEAHRKTLYRERHKLQRTLCRLDVRSLCLLVCCLHIKHPVTDAKQRPGFPTSNIKH